MDFFLKTKVLLPKVYEIFESEMPLGSHGAFSKMCRLGFCFQNLPFSKFDGKTCAVFV